MNTLRFVHRAKKIIGKVSFIVLGTADILCESC